MYHCVAYVNFLNGQPVNVKYRSCDPSTIKATDEGETTGREKAAGYTKFWSQDSPTTPCPPYHIDCINPLKVAEETVPDSSSPKVKRCAYTRRSRLSLRY